MKRRDSSTSTQESQSSAMEHGKDSVIFEMKCALSEVGEAASVGMSDSMGGSMGRSEKDGIDRASRENG